MNWIIGLILYSILGIALGVAGVRASDQPWHFIAIMLIVVLIDLNAKFSK